MQHDKSEEEVENDKDLQSAAKIAVGDAPANPDEEKGAAVKDDEAKPKKNEDGVSYMELGVCFFLVFDS
jgi:hypothetical protein